MKKLFPPFLFSIFYFAVCLQAQDTYKSYCNNRFTFCVNYPANLVNPQPESTNGDGCEMRAKQGKAKVTTWGNYAPTYAIEGTSDFDRKAEVKKVFEDAMVGKTITYKVLKDTWFVLSGTDKEGNIFYHKSMFQDLAFITVLIEYPKAEKATWDKQCGKISNSLKFN